MHGNLPLARNGASNRPAACGSDFGVTAASGSDAENWLKTASSALLGKDAGLHLHYITGYPERSCYYYASGERAAPADFLRKLFRSPQGEPFLLAFMQDCDADWWREHERARRVGLQVIEIAKRE